MKSVICIKNFDPCFGFKIIRRGETVQVRSSDISSGDQVIHLFNEAGHLIGTIYRSDMSTHFSN